jgi:hypothetical protein
MLPPESKPKRFGEWEQESWDDYRDRLALPDERARLEFYRQVVYDHFSHFNDHFPDFDIDTHTFAMRKMSVAEVREKVRFFGNEDLGPFWAGQYEEFRCKNQDYIIYQEMSNRLTPPFPPITLDPSALEPQRHLDYGRPIHLVEGTHRTSYLIQMAELDIISWDSEHDFVHVAPLP